MKKILLFIGAISIFTILFCVLAPIKYVTVGSYIKTTEKENLALDQKAGKYALEKNIGKCDMRVDSKTFHAHIKYLSIIDDQVLFDCWIDEDDQLDYGFYKFDTCLGEIKLWSVLLNIF